MTAQQTPKDAFHLRPSRVLKKIRAGGVASSIKINLSDPRVIDIVGASGFDSVWLDTEHVPSCYGDIEHQVRTARIHDMDAIVRVPRGSYTDYIRPLEMDAAAIMVPHIMGLDDAKQVVRMTKFPPLGRRAMDGGNADGLYCRVTAPDYVEEANRERFVIFQIEDPEAVPDIDAIAELPGVDMILLGPGDFSLAIGKPGEVFAPEVQAVREKIAAAARAAGKAAGACGTLDTLQTLVDMGYNFVSVGADVIAMSAYADTIADRFRAL